jgi:hypothetical protein
LLVRFADAMLQLKLVKRRDERCAAAVVMDRTSLAPR